MTHSTDPPAKIPAAFPPEEPTPTSPIPASPAGPHAVANDTEELYYSGSPLLRGELGHGILWILIGLVFIAIPFAYHAMTKTKDWPLWWVTLALVVVGLFFLFLPYIKAKSIRYRITNYRIDVQHGLLATSIDTIELWHVEDLRFHQSLIARIFGIGDITILSKHPTMPVLLMRSLPNSRHLFTELEQRVIAVKRLSGVVKVDPGT